MTKTLEPCDTFMRSLPTRPFNALYSAGFRTREQVETAAMLDRLGAYLGTKSEYVVREALQGRKASIDERTTDRKRKKRIYALRKAGHSYKQIAKLCGISTQRVSQICRQCMSEEDVANAAAHDRDDTTEQVKAAIQTVADYYGIDPSDVCRVCLRAAADKDEELRRWNETMSVFNSIDTAEEGVTE